MAYAVGHISGGHFNPAVTVGLAFAKRFAWKDVAVYVVSQVVAAIVAATILFAIASGVAGFSAHETGFAANGFGAHSPGGFSLLAVIIAETVLTAFFLYIILGSTDSAAPKGFAPIAIGLGLTLIHLISIPISNTSVNPARSIGVALYAGGWAIGQVWVFILFPLVGAAIAGLTYASLFGGKAKAAPLEEATEG